MSRSVDAVIFDQDGTLVESESLWPEIDAEYFTKLLGIPGWVRWQPKWLDLKGRGMPLDEIFGLLKHIFALPQEVAEIKSVREEVMLSHYRERLTRCDGAEVAIRHFASKNIPIGIASGMSVRILESVRDLMGWTPFIPVLASTHETRKGKPDPSVYLLAAERLGVPPERCLAFENDLNGFLSATGAGMACRAIPDTDLRRNDFSVRHIPFFPTLRVALDGAP